MAKVKLNINLPFIKLDLEGDEKQLIEVRKLVCELGKMSITELEQEALDELVPSLSLPTWKLSRELQKKDHVIDNLIQMSQVEEGVVVKKASINNINEITDKGTLSRINLTEIKEGISKLLDDIDSSKVNFALIHAMGNLPEDNFSIIFDQIKMNLPHCKVDSVKTKKEVMGKTILECVLFGSFPEE